MRQKQSTKPHEVPQSPEWFIWGSSYSPPPAALFCLNFLDRNWFGLKLPPPEAMMLVRLLTKVYAVQKQGLLMSKKDVMRAIGAEHISTVTRYTQIAEKLGFLKMGKAELDSRLQLFFLTPEGERAVERELEEITKSAQWLLAELSEDADDRVRAHELRSSITVDPPTLGELTLVADKLVRVPANRSGTDEYRFRPLTARRWLAAYGETLNFDANNRNALDARSETAAGLVGDYKTAMEDLDKLVKIDPAYLARRARLHEDLGNHDEAIADIDRLCELRPNAEFPAWRITRAKAFAAKGNWRKANADLEAVFAHDIVKDTSGPYDWTLLRGLVLAKLGRAREAIPWLEKTAEALERYAGMYQEELERAEPLLSMPRQEITEHLEYFCKQLEYVQGMLGEFRRSSNSSAASKRRAPKK